jgi:predicted aconitase with swiveling domain
MAGKIVLHGRGIVGGEVEGRSLVLKQPLSFWSGLDPETGVLRRGQVDSGLVGKSIKGKILVYPFGRGSTAGGGVLYRSCQTGNAPLAIINMRLDTVVANGVIAANVPTVIELDQNPCQVIETEDLVKVDADKGIVMVFKEKS